MTRVRENKDILGATGLAMLGVLAYSFWGAHIIATSAVPTQVATTNLGF